MKRSFTAVLASLALTFGAGQASAENLLQIFQLALENDPQLKAAQAERDALKEQRAQSLARFFPSLSASANVVQKSETWEQNLTYIVDPQTGKLEEWFGYTGPNPYRSYNYYLTLRQPVFDLTIFRNFQASGISVIKSEVEYRLAQQNLLYRIVENYFNVLAKQDSLNFARAEKNAIARQLQQTRDRFEAGLIAVTDVHEAQARHDLSVAKEIQAETELAHAQEQLREITKESPKALFTLKASTPLIPPTPTNIKDWVEATRVQNLGIAAAQLEADMAKRKIDAFVAERYPTMDIVANYGYSQQGGIFTQAYQDASVALNARIDLFRGNAVTSKIRQARLELEAANQRTEQKEREATTETRNAYLGVLAGLSYVKALSQAASSSESALKATEAGFEVGTRSAIEVLDAQREVFRNQRDLAQSRYDYILNTLKLKLAVGLLTIDDVEQVNGWLE